MCPTVWVSSSRVSSCDTRTNTANRVEDQEEQDGRRVRSDVVVVTFGDKVFTINRFRDPTAVFVLLTTRPLGRVRRQRGTQQVVEAVTSIQTNYTSNRQRTDEDGRGPEGQTKHMMVFQSFFSSVSFSSSSIYRKLGCICRVRIRINQDQPGTRPTLFR